MEIWDAYYRDGTLAGCELVRGEPTKDGLYHIVVDILVRHVDGEFLLMQRDTNKRPFPGKYEASAGGCILKGETPYIGAVRELREETGIHTDKLTYYYTVTDDGNNTIYMGYLCETDCAKDTITLQQGETINYRWISKDDFLKFIKGDEFTSYERFRWVKYLDRI